MHQLRFVHHEHGCVTILRDDEGKSFRISLCEAGGCTMASASMT
jgi:hypothetical protein